ncbi:MAG: hypothetical protein P8H43_05090 [Crocinitomicaceae bacterium]|nr:hypothetical protein [Crocinitomicaceae bacterium]
MLENITGEELKNQFKTNKKLRLITLIVGSAALLALGYFIYLQFVWTPKNEESKGKYWPGLNLAVADSTDAALESLKPIKDKYNGYIGGEIAQFVYARQLMSKSEFKKALQELEDISVEDTYVKVMAIGLQGDCYSDMEQYDSAFEKYMEAAEMQENDLTAPIYLKKAGLCAEALNNFDIASTNYKTIMDNYADFARENQIERYYARANNKTTK